MRQITVLLFIGISICARAQEVVKDSTKSLGNIIQLVIKDTSKREETKKTPF